MFINDVMLEHVLTIVHTTLVMKVTEAVFLVSLRMSSFPAGNEAYGKSLESLFLAGNELAPSSFPA